MSDELAQTTSASAERRRWWRRSAIGALVMASTGFAGILGSSWWIRRATAKRIVSIHEAVTNRADHADVVIVPGARVYADSTVSVALRHRLMAALQLYRARIVKKILLSGDHRRVRYDEVNAMLRWMLAHGVPKDVIYLDHAGFRTLDTMLRAARIFKIRRAFVTTQAFHLPRSLFLADYAGIDAIGVIADRETYPDARFNEARELFAQARAMLDRYVLRLGPSLGGPPIPIDGPAQATHDRYSDRIRSFKSH
ncbi:MAG: YdcF family protein [Myxococcales bacterium]|nr:YdcF family protein [Myxococcales bacterium]